MTISDLQEDIVKLFLRLNGYITTGLIIHSDEKFKNKTEIDLIAVRFPFHNQEDRVLKSSDYLQIPDKTIDIIIGEVKGGRNVKNQFNPSLRDDSEAIEKLVNWIGVIEPEKNKEIINWLIEELKPKEKNVLGDFPQFNINNQFSIRPIVFNLDISKPNKNQKRLVYGDLMLNYIWDCFRPENERATCSTTYPVNMWGHNLTPIVEYFKDNNKVRPGTPLDLYKHFGFKS